MARGTRATPTPRTSPRHATTSGPNRSNSAYGPLPPTYSQVHGKTLPRMRN